jgi:DNA-binding MarR family transcriptional regulator
LPTALTELGRDQLRKASAAVKQVEDRMSSGLTAAERDQLRSLLSRCVSSLGDTA